MGGGREPMKLYPPHNMKKRFCPRGHDKLEVGVAVNFQCAQCRKDASLRENRIRRGWKGGDSTNAVYIKNLKRIRLELGLTVNEFAAYMGISPGTYIGLQSERRRAGRDIQMKVLRGVVAAQRDAKRQRAQGGYHLNLVGVGK